MDLKSDDLFNIELDPAILLSYDLEQLNLDSIPNNIFEEEVSTNDFLVSNAEKYRDPSAENDRDSGDENEEDSDSENNVSPECKCSEDSSAKLFAEVDKLSCVDVHQEKVENIQVGAPSRKTKRKIDINGNEELPQDETLNDLFVQLELLDSDSDNEVQDEESTGLRERGPVRPQRKAYRIRKQTSNWNKIDVHDRAQFNPERLIFLSGGSSQIQSNEVVASAQYPQVPCHESLTASSSGSDLSCLLPNQDLFYDDARAVSVSSPESGYDSSSALSVTGSPPPFNLDLIPENVDEQITDLLLELESALTNNLSVCERDEKVAKDKIISFLKKAEAQNSSDAVVPNDGVLNPVPSPDNSGEPNFDGVLYPPVLYPPVRKSVDSVKRIAPLKTDDKARKNLREVLDYDEFYAVAERIYKKVLDDKANMKKCEVIYVEDEDDKTSELRTNLHYAVLNSKIEDIFCLVEIHKQYGYSLGVINNRDKYGKTALDYAIQNESFEMSLVVDYLKENHGIQSIKLSK